MRVISGSARGRKLIAPEGLDTRPTTDRVKESIFNIVAPYLPAENVLDLFAGSGALGIEALSRSSKHAVFVEKDRNILHIINRNLSDVRLSEKAEVICSDAISFLNRHKTKFDIIFLDPPYNTGLLTEAVNKIFDNSLLKQEGIIVAESAYGGEEPPCEHFDIVKRAKYGKTNIFVLRHNKAEV